MEGLSESQRVFDEGLAMLDKIDEVRAQQDKERTMGSMALSSYCEDMFHHAMDKFHLAFELRKAAEDGKLEA